MTTDQHGTIVRRNDTVCAIVDVQLHIYRIREFSPFGFPRVSTWDTDKRKFVGPLRTLRSKKFIKINWP